MPSSARPDRRRTDDAVDARRGAAGHKNCELSVMFHSPLFRAPLIMTLEPVGCQLHRPHRLSR